ncbi:hypothetical protein DNTS_006176 [Danionella cerebrum]|uniref:Heat shock transcription factor 2 binding protein n=1 Tax=Danionella cerebrum TaxID=2873325 RepID=A0A553N0T4_9TELE|nr:hypothetical protein DNTS_006176 [Danionella translucida]
MKTVHQANVSSLSSAAEGLESDCFVRVRKRDLETMEAEIRTLRELLPEVISGDFLDIMHKGLSADAFKERCSRELQKQNDISRQMRSRLNAALAESQREKQEKVVLKQQLWESREQLQQQRAFSAELGTASCTLLWSVSQREEVVKDMLSDNITVAMPKCMAVQTLETFMEEKAEQDQNSQEHHFVLALTGIVTNMAAVSCGRDFLSTSAHTLLRTMLKVLSLIEPGVFPKLKVLMLMALYNVTISVNGLKFISESSGLLPLFCTLLEDPDAEVCLQALRLLQSLLLEREMMSQVMPEFLTSFPLSRIQHLASSKHPSLKQTAQETLDDLAGFTNIQNKGSGNK